MKRLAILLVVLMLGACAREPWVKPYEREALAEPLMSFYPDPISEAYMMHVYEVREAARGGNRSQGGGCGCN